MILGQKMTHACHQVQFQENLMDRFREKLKNNSFTSPHFGHNQNFSQKFVSF